MTEVARLTSRVSALEAEIVEHRRAAMLIFLEYVARRPQERPHLITLLRELGPLMSPEAASISNALIDEISKVGR